MLQQVMTHTRFRREDLVSAAEYVLDCYVPEGLEEFGFGYFMAEHRRRGAIDKWVISRAVVVPRKGLCKAPICKLVIGPHGQDMGAMSVVAITVRDSNQDFSEYEKSMEFNSNFRENLIKSILATAQRMFPAEGSEMRQKPGEVKMARYDFSFLPDANEKLMLDLYFNVGLSVSVILKRADCNRFSSEKPWRNWLTAMRKQYPGQIPARKPPKSDKM
jgi:hypothetical protein